MITFSDLQWLCEKLDQSLSGLGTCFPSREERLAEEERRAWDGYLLESLKYVVDVGSRGVSVSETEDAIDLANRMLKERRKRFGAGKEAPKPCLLTVTEDLLARTIEALVGDSGAEERAVLAQQLRALVSE